MHIAGKALAQLLDDLVAGFYVGPLQVAQDPVVVGGLVERIGNCAAKGRELFE